MPLSACTYSNQYSFFFILSQMITTELCVPPQVGALSPRIAALPDSFRSKFLGVFPLSLLPTLPGDDAESTQVPENAFYDDGM